MSDTAKRNALNRVYLKNHILRVDVIGDQTQETVEDMGRQLTDHIVQLRKAGQKVLLLDNVQKIGRTDMQAVRAVAILGRILDYDRAAMVGDGSAPMRTGINLLLRTIRRSSIQYFSNLKDAETWLREFN
ncbi:MAG TPA: STAS/SEC14 domain-containing protein [Candidatus Saccharimonadia bacterium]